MAGLSQDEVLEINEMADTDLEWIAGGGGEIPPPPEDPPFKA